MADNTLLNLGSGGDTLASDDIAGVKFQRFKMVTGIDGTNDGDVADTNPLPVKINDETHIEDTNFPAAARVFPAGAQFDDAAINAMDEDDVGVPRMSGNRNLYGTIRDAAGAERGVNVTAANELNVIATAQSGVDLGDVGILDGPTGASALQGQGAGAEATPPVGNPVLMGIDDSTNVRNLAGDSSGRILLGAGDLNIGNVDIVTGPTGASALEMQGTAAIGVAPVGDPVFMAARANANEPAVVDDGDIVPPWLDLFGRLVTVESHPTMEALDEQVLTLGSQVDLIAAPGASISIYVKAIFLSNTNATTSIRADIKDGTTVKNSMFLVSDGGGNNRYFSGPGWKLTANTALTAELSAAHTDVRVTTLYYLAP